MIPHHIKEMSEAEPFFTMLDRWTNNKNGELYTVAGLGWHSETLEVLVSYVDSDGKLWHRPWGLFLKKFTLTHPKDSNYDSGGILQ